MADKKGRVQQIIKKDISEIILYELKAPICQFASVTEAKMTSDYSYCTIYVSHIDPDKTDELVAFLNNRKGLIRSMLAKRLDIYKTPELTFLADHLFDKGQEMDKKIEEAINRPMRTLKDVYGEEEKPAPKKSTPKKKTATKKSTAEKTATTKKATAKKTAAKKKAVTKKVSE